MFPTVGGNPPPTATRQVPAPPRPGPCPPPPGIPLLVVVDGSGHQITREARNLVHGDEPHHYRHVWARLAAP